MPGVSGTEIVADLGRVRPGAPALLVSAVYLRGYERPPHHASGGGVAEVLKTALQFLSVGFGPPAEVTYANETTATCIYVVALARS